MKNRSSFGGKRRQVLLLALSAVYAICLVWGREIMIADTVKYKSAEVLFSILFYIVFIYIILNIIFILINLIDYKITSDSPLLSILNSYIKMSDWKLFFCALASIVVCWLPTYIACFPGLGIYDGPTQLTTLSTHHPVMHTLLIHFCGALADCIGWSSWLFPYAIIQSLFLAVAFSYLLVTLNRWKIPKIVIILVDVWFCIFPMHALMALASTKDSIFAGFLFCLFVN